MTSSPTPEGPDSDARHGLSRRGLIGGAAAAAAVSLGSGLMRPATASTRGPTSEGMMQDHSQTRPVDPHSEEFTRWAREHAAGPNAEAKLPPPVAADGRSGHHARKG